MSRYLVIIVSLVSFSLSALQRNSDTPDGQIFQNVDDNMIAWDAEKQKWMEIEHFWMSYTKRNGGKAWGTGRVFPNYSEVNEFDTFLYETKKGKCLMAFYHERWRRAQDVERWDERHNEYGGCPFVFDE